MNRVRIRHWSNTKLADWLRELSGLPRIPAFATQAERESLEVQGLRRNPVMFWLIQSGMDKLQRALCLPADMMRQLTSYLNAGLVRRTHILATAVRFGEFAGYDRRIDSAVFRAIVDYVECDQAEIHIALNPEEAEQMRWPRIHWYRRLRCPEAGIARLEWAARFDGTLRMQAAGASIMRRRATEARELLAIYRWWTSLNKYRQQEHEGDQMLIRAIRMRHAMY